MGILATLFLAVSLALDALAVALALSVASGALRLRQMLWIALYFGGFQWMMTMSGWLVGHGLHGYLKAVDHWCVFAVLALVGLRMIAEARKPGQGSALLRGRLTARLLCFLALATSIDALAAGVSVAFLQANITRVSLVVGVVAFALSLAGAAAGRRLQRLVQGKALILGGLVLIGIGAKTLVEHLLGLG